MVELVKQNFEENKKYYRTIENKLRDNIDKSIPIEHVGSTAIPEIEFGKNIIDILIGAADLNQFEEIKKILESDGYVASLKSRDNIYQFFSSTADESGSGDIHIHLVIMNTDRYNDFIILRDYLLMNSLEAKKYSDFKVKIINLMTTDRKEYKRIKSEYVSELLERARKWYKGNE